MLADLKAKAAGVDRKRVYTAAAALLIAGAAGHFMQQTSGGARGPAMMSASVPAVSAPEILSTPPEADAPGTVAAGPQAAASDSAAATAPDILPTEPAIPSGETTADAGPETPQTVVPDAATTDTAVATATDEAADDAAPQIVVAAPVATMRPAPKPRIIPEAVTPDTIIAETGTASTAIYPAPEADRALEEVTRAATDPLLTITEPTPERDKQSLFAAASDEMDMPPATSMAPAEPEVAGCAISVEGTAKPGAILELAVAAPCNSGETVSFDHAGLKFGEQLGPDGSLTVEVPAMTGTATVAIGFADGADRDVEVTVPDFEAFDRIAVVWQGATGLQLHALEGGADYGAAGHVWADTPGSLDAAVAGTGGFVSVLGSTASGFAADVYTYPAALMRQGVEPEVSIEAEVMENTCGGEIEGWILRTNPGKAPHVEPLTMVVPGCDAVGEFLVLKNLPVELKLARR